MLFRSYSCEKEREENDWKFGSTYSSETNLFEDTLKVNFEIWLPKSQIKVKDNVLLIPDWLFNRNSNKVFCSKEQTNLEEYKIYPYHCELTFGQISELFLINWKSEGSMGSMDYEDDDWMRNGIGDWSMQGW